MRWTANSLSWNSLNLSLVSAMLFEDIEELPCLIALLTPLLRMIEHCCVVQSNSQCLWPTSIYCSATDNGRVLWVSPPPPFTKLSVLLHYILGTSDCSDNLSQLFYCIKLLDFSVSYLSFNYKYGLYFFED